MIVSGDMVNWGLVVWFIVAACVVTFILAVFVIVVRAAFWPSRKGKRDVRDMR